MLYRNRVKYLAQQVGFDLCEVVASHPLSLAHSHFSEWLGCGYHSELGYLVRNIEKRFDPSLLFEGAETIVVCGVNYRNQISEGYPKGATNKIASYACTTDYHFTIKQMLSELLEILKQESPSLQGRAFTDSAPIAEKSWAVEAGLGWIGRNSLLITPEYGSFVVLGELILSERMEGIEEIKPRSNGCGECRKCVEACPNGAIIEGNRVDTNRCISRLTVERAEQSASQDLLHGWCFGCDECQTACPHNRNKPQHSNARFDILFDPREVTPQEWAEMSQEELMLRFSKTPLKRTFLGHK